MLVALLLLLPIMAVDSYTSGAINLLVRTSTTSDIQRYCIELAKLPNGRVVNITTFGWHVPYLALPSVNACDISNLNTSLPSSFPSNNTILIIYEHDCKMTEHAWNVEKQFGPGISLMIITNRTDTQYDLSYNTTAMPVSIPVLVFWQDDFGRMTAKYGNLNSVQLSITDPPDLSKTFRPAIILMFLLVFVVLICGNFWAADEFKSKLKIEEREPNNQSSTTTIEERESNNQLSVINTSTTTIGEPVSEIITKRKSTVPREMSRKSEPAILPMTYCVIVLIIFFAVGWLLLLYYFPKVMIYILQVIFAIAAFTSLTTCFNRLSRFVPIIRRYRTPYHRFKKPCKCKLGPLNLFTIFAMMISLTLVIIWYVYRERDWAWVLQDILGASMCMTVISMYRLGNMRVITVILVAFFIYDIFFVFITPYIPIFQQQQPSNSSTSKNPSVMEQVALGIGSNGETVPLVFTLPLLVPESEMDPCLSERKSVLGFGDVILPGILLTFCKIFDIASANRWPIYYIQSVISYFVGLIITYVALYTMGTAQPALLYLVPCLLISTIITSLCRRELKEIYTGKRIKAMLDRETASHDNVNDERRSSDIVVGITDPTGADYF